MNAYLIERHFAKIGVRTRFTRSRDVTAPA